ncbi:MAG: hypothetical protein COW69_00035, partial [Candidatus Huberarchaeum crystalense]
GANNWEKTRPVHKVNIIKPFYIGVFPVTQGEWKTVMGTNPSYLIGDNLPVESVSWNDCQNFISKLNIIEGKKIYRLPTEAEWEYACRAGSQSKYFFGDDESLLHEFAWFDENSDDKTHSVGEKKPNKWGLYDMHGNVWEWCQNGYKKSYRDNESYLEPIDSFRVFREGSFYDPYIRCLSSNRYGFQPDYFHASIGFRILMSKDDTYLYTDSITLNKGNKNLQRRD